MRPAFLRHLPTIAMTAACIAIACVAASPVSAIGQGGGKPASADQLPPDAGYDASECVDVTDYVSCDGQYVLACCTSTACGYVVTDGSTYWLTACASTSDCQNAADAVLAYCGGGDSGAAGDTGYDSTHARQRLLRASGKR